MKRLRELGVWLLDTSVAALYLPKRPKPAPALIESCLQVSWDYHVRHLVESAEPSHIICIGRGVAKALGQRLSVIDAPATVLAQPNARLATAEHVESFQTYYRVVQDANRDDPSSPAV